MSTPTRFAALARHHQHIADLYDCLAALMGREPEFVGNTQLHIYIKPSPGGDEPHIEVRVEVRLPPPTFDRWLTDRPERAGRDPRWSCQVAQMRLSTPGGPVIVHVLRWALRPLQLQAAP